jgi:deoxyribose-phosphate aldolase
VKTSTGKVSPAATLPVTMILLEAVRDWYATTVRPPHSGPVIPN